MGRELFHVKQFLLTDAKVLEDFGKDVVTVRLPGDGLEGMLRFPEVLREENLFHAFLKAVVETLKRRFCLLKELIMALVDGNEGVDVR